MLPVEEALSLITKSAASHPPKTATLSTIPPTLEGQAPAHSHVTGSLVLAREDLPNYRASIKDGYAVVSGDGPGVYQVVAVSKMGHNSGIVLESGTVSRVTTGIISHMFPGLPQVLLVTFFQGCHRYY